MSRKEARGEFQNEGRDATPVITRGLVENVSTGLFWALIRRRCGGSCLMTSGSFRE